MAGLRVFAFLTLLILTAQFTAGLTLLEQPLQDGGWGRQATPGSVSSVKVYVSPSEVYSFRPSFIFVQSWSRPTVNVTLTVTVELGGPLGGAHTFTGSYSLEAIPVAWAPQWYMVPVPGLPAASLADYSVKSRVDYVVLVEGGVVASGGYDILEGGVEQPNPPPLVYAFVGEVLSDTGLVEETWGLSPRGWSLKAGAEEEIYVFAADDTGVKDVALEYRVSGGSWVNVSLADSGLLNPILDVVEQIRGSLSQVIPQLEGLTPVFPAKLLVGSIPGQVAGTYVEYRAYAVDVNGSVSYAPHGLYYVDKGGGSRVLIVDPWVTIWTLTRVALDHRPVVAADLAHGERSELLDKLVSEIGFAEWAVINDAITSESLERVDILIIGQPQQPFTQEELDAIAEWLGSGGKVVWVAGDSDYRDGGFDGPASQEICNGILATLGSRLRLETGGVYDDTNNIGGKSYRVLGFAKPDFAPGMHTQIISAGVSRPILFHGPTAIIWVDENGEPHDPVQETFPGLVRIAWTANTSRIQYNSPPPPILYDPTTARNRSFVLMAAEKLATGSLVIASGETPYGGYVPISKPEYGGAKLDGPQFVENVILWASLHVHRSRYLPYIDGYRFPPGNVSELGTVSLQLGITGIANFHHWEYLGETNDIYIVWPSPRVAELLEPPLQGGFEPHVIVLSNLGLGLNWTGTPFFDWDLRDVRIPEGGTLLDKLVQYVKNSHAGLIATHSTLSDLIIWGSCDTRVKVGSRGHVGYSLSDLNIMSETSIAAMLGMPQLALWEYVRDQVAYKLCSMGEEMGATPMGAALYAAGLVVGSTPLQVPHIPWNGALTVTSEGKTLNWSIPSEITVYVPSIYGERGYNAYTEVGWQLALPRSLAYAAMMAANTTVDDAATLYGYLSTLVNNHSLGEPLNHSLRGGGLRLLYDSIVNASYTQGALKVTIGMEALDSQLRGLGALQLDINMRNVTNTLLRLMPVKLVAVSSRAEAAIVAHDKYWDENGYRAVYFSFEVEASPNETAKTLLLEALKWVSEWKYLGSLDLIGGKLPVPRETKETYDQILENISGREVLGEELILPEGGAARLEIDAVQGNKYHAVIVHPTTDSLKIKVRNGEIEGLVTDNKITHITINAASNELGLTVKPASQLSLNPAYITVKEEEVQTTTIYETVTETTTITVTSAATITKTKTATMTRSTTETHTVTKTETTTKTATITKTQPETTIVTQTQTETITRTHTQKETITQTAMETAISLAGLAAVIALVVGLLIGRKAR